MIINNLFLRKDEDNVAANLFTIPNIPSYENNHLEETIRNRLDNLTKPKGSLGRLETCTVQYLLCRGSADAEIKKSHVYTFAADHGITAQQITPYPKEVTAQMVLNMIGGGAAVNVLAKHAGIRCSVVDVGVASELPEHSQLLNYKITSGTEDFSRGNAMNAEHCCKALTTGIEIALSSDTDLLGCGEMGIGNSASAAALYALLLDCDGASTTGAGTGSSGSLLEKKKRVISDAVNFHRKQWDHTPFDALCRCGGLEIAAITGVMIGAASKRIPVVVDGFICGAAALCALRFNPDIANYLFFAHVSAEQFHRKFLENEGIVPLLDLGMRLGEGTGSVLGMQIIQQALNCYHEMATFSSASVSKEIS